MQEAVYASLASNLGLHYGSQGQAPERTSLAEALLPAREVARDRRLVEPQAGGHAFEDAGQRRAVGLSGGQQARFQVLLLELSGATLLLLDEPTDNLDLASAESLENALERYEGTVITVTHDRWFTRGFTRFLNFGNDGRVYETPEPIFEH